MADNTTLNPGVGGDLIATDDIGGVKYQWVKAAFGGDGAVVPVELADGKGLPVQVAPGSTSTDTIDSNGDTITIELKGASTVLFTFVNSAFTGTVLSEGSIDGGVTYGTCLCWQIGATANSGGSQVATNAGMSVASVGGMTHFRIRVSAYTSGSAVCTMRTSNTQGIVQVLNGAIGNVASIGTNINPGTGTTSLGKAEDAAHTSGDTGVMALAVRNDTEANVTSLSADYSQISTDAAGRVIVTPKPTGFASGSIHRLVSAATTNATSVKAAQGNLYSLLVMNNNAAARYLKLYNKASAPTVGTDVPVATILLAAGPVQLPPIVFPVPMGFSAGIAYALTTGVADGDTAAVGAGDVYLTANYA